jgi:hypothetical protein
LNHFLRPSVEITQKSTLKAFLNEGILPTNAIKYVFLALPQAEVTSDRAKKTECWLKVRDSSYSSQLQVILELK